MKDKRIGQITLALGLHGLLLAALASSTLGGIVLASLLPLSPLFCLAGIGVSLAGCIISWQKPRLRLIWMLTIFLLLGAWRYTITTPRENPRSIAHLVGSRKLLMRGVVTTEPTTTARSRSLLIETREVSRDNGNTWQGMEGTFRVTVKGTASIDPYGANYGDDVEVRGTLEPPSDAPPDVLGSMSFPYVRVTDHEGNPLLEALLNLRVTLSENISRALPQPEAAILVAIFLSLRTPSLAPLSPAFNATGTAHLIAASGFKVTLLAGLLSRGLSQFYRQPGKLLPAQQRRDWRLWLKTLLVLGCIGSYTVLSGASSAATRAGIMGALLYISPRLGRRYNVYTALAATALFMSLCDPLVLWDVGFQLSFLGTLGILVLTPTLQHLLRFLKPLPGGIYIAEMLSVTLAAQAATLPIVAITFHNISLIAPLANLLTVPLLGSILMLGLLVSTLCPLHMLFAQGSIWIAWPILHYITVCIEWCYHLPWSFIEIDNIPLLLAWCYYVLLALWCYILLTRQVQNTKAPEMRSANVSPHAPQAQQWGLSQALRIGLVLLTLGSWGLLLIQAYQQPHTSQITFLNLGTADHPQQGSAILIRTADNHASLIDGGMDSVALTQMLDSHLPLWQRTLDTVLLTTPREDHITGLQDVVKRYTIGRVVDAGMLHPTATYARWRRTISERDIPYFTVQQGNSMVLGGNLQLQVLWPTSLHKSSDEARDNCLIVRLLMPGFTLLLLSVAGVSTYALQGILSSIQPDDLRADVVQLESATSKPYPSVLRTLFERVEPSTLIVTPAISQREAQEVGNNERYFSAFDGLHMWSLDEVRTLAIRQTDQGWLTYTENNQSIARYISFF